MTTLFLTVGLPGGGKTTRARQLAEEHGALRLAPDEWMIPLFGESDAGGKRDVLEGRFLSLALQALRVGTDVILDLGCWSRDERSAIRRPADSARATCRLVHLPVDPGTQRPRIAHRQATTPDRTFPMSEADLLRWRTAFQEPTPEELSAPGIPAPPPGSPTWRAWSAARWPSFA